jgi:large conductance mechanosensitive channel
MRKLWQEFKTFAFKGNMIDLAVAVVIGAAFGAVIASLVKNIIMPALSYMTPGEASYRTWQIGRVEIGAFIAEVINFLIIAAAIFLVVVKLLGSVLKRAQPAPPPAGPTTKECPFCLSVIPLKARRCAHCIADLEAGGLKGTASAPRPA